MQGWPIVLARDCTTILSLSLLLSSLSSSSPLPPFSWVFCYSCDASTLQSIWCLEALWIYLLSHSNWQKKHLTVFHPSPSLHLSFYLFILPIHLIIHHHHCWSSPASLLLFFLGPEFDYGALKVCDFTGPGCDVLYKWNHRCIKMLKKIGKTSVFNPYVSLHCCHSDIPVIAVRVSAGQFTPDKCALCK